MGCFQLRGLTLQTCSLQGKALDASWWPCPHSMCSQPRSAHLVPSLQGGAPRRTWRPWKNLGNSRSVRDCWPRPSSHLSRRVRGRLPLSPTTSPLCSLCHPMSSMSLYPCVSLSFRDPNVPSVSLRPLCLPMSRAPQGHQGPAWVLVMEGCSCGCEGACAHPGASSPLSFPWFLQTPVFPSTTRVSDRGRTLETPESPALEFQSTFSASSHPPKRETPPGQAGVMPSDIGPGGDPGHLGTLSSTSEGQLPRPPTPWALIQSRLWPSVTRMFMATWERLWPMAVHQGLHHSLGKEEGGPGTCSACSPDPGPPMGGSPTSAPLLVPRATWVCTP